MGSQSQQNAAGCHGNPGPLSSPASLLLAGTWPTPAEEKEIFAKGLIGRIVFECPAIVIQANYELWQERIGPQRDPEGLTSGPRSSERQPATRETGRLHQAPREAESS